MEMSLLEPEERREIAFIWDMIPVEDKQGMTEEDVLLVLDAMDDFLEEEGLLHVDEESGEVEYEDGEVDETAQMAYVAQAAKAQGSGLTMVQIQLIMDQSLKAWLLVTTESSSQVLFKGECLKNCIVTL